MGCGISWLGEDVESSLDVDKDVNILGMLYGSRKSEPSSILILEASNLYILSVGVPGY